MNFETLKYEMTEQAHVAMLTINRPEALNALNGKVITELSDFTDFIQSTEARALVVTGSGEKSFVAGADIKEMKALDKQGAEALSRAGQGAFSKLENLEIPVIAAVNGFALGGGMELALSCDFIFASEKAKFGLPEVGLGLIPGYGGTQRLSRVVGPAKAKMLALSGEMISAEKAHQLGLVAELFSAQELLKSALEFAGKIAAKAPRAVALAKQAIKEGQDLTLAEGLLVESRLFAETFETEDRHEGISAFIEKRKPVFHGK